MNTAGGEQIVFVLNIAGLAHRPLSAQNDAVLAKAGTAVASKYEFTGANGDTVHGWIMPPVDFNPNKTYPVAFLIHGGPQGRVCRVVYVHTI